MMLVHLYGTEVWARIIPVSVCGEELETEIGASERASERNRERERGCVCVRICVREREISARPRLRVYSRQFGERNRKRALSRERDSGFEQIEMKEEEEREKQRKGSPVGLRPVPGKRNRAGG